MGGYKGAKYIGGMPVSAPKLGVVINPGDIVDMPEEEAKGREDFEAVYDTSPPAPLRKRRGEQRREVIPEKVKKEDKR